MILSCPACATRYRVNDASPEAAGPTHTCRYCDHVWGPGVPEAEPPTMIGETPAPEAEPAKLDASIAATDPAPAEETVDFRKAIQADPPAWYGAPPLSTGVDMPADLPRLIAAPWATPEEREPVFEEPSPEILPDRAASDAQAAPIETLFEEPGPTPENPPALPVATPTEDPRAIWNTQEPRYAAWPSDRSSRSVVLEPVPMPEDPPIAPIATPTDDPRAIWNTLESPYSAWPADPETSPEPLMTPLIVAADPVVEPTETPGSQGDNADGMSRSSENLSGENTTRIIDGADSAAIDAAVFDTPAEPIPPLQETPPADSENEIGDHSSSFMETAAAAEAEEDGPAWLGHTEGDQPQADPHEGQVAEPAYAEFADETEWSQFEEPDWLAGLTQPAESIPENEPLLGIDPPIAETTEILERPASEAVEEPEVSPARDEGPFDLSIQSAEPPEIALSLHAPEPTTAETEDEIGDQAVAAMAANEDGMAPWPADPESAEQRPEFHGDEVAAPEDRDSVDEPASSQLVDWDRLDVPTDPIALVPEPAPQVSEAADQWSTTESAEIALPDDLAAHEDGALALSAILEGDAKPEDAGADETVPTIDTVTPEFVVAEFVARETPPADIEATAHDDRPPSIEAPLPAEPIPTSPETVPLDAGSAPEAVEIVPQEDLAAREESLLVLSDVLGGNGTPENIGTARFVPTTDPITPEFVATDTVVHEATAPDIDAIAQNDPPSSIAASETSSQSTQLVVTKTPGRALIPMSAFGPKEPVELESGSKAQIWIALAAACLLIVSGLGIFRDQIVAAWPPAGQAYAAIHWPAPVGTGLQLSPAVIALSTDNGRPVFLLTGTIANRSSAALPLPKLHVSLLGQHEQEMRAFDMDAGKESLNPGELTTFSLSIENPPADASKARVIFVGS